jgi:hypothetical protein
MVITAKSAGSVGNIIQIQFSNPTPAPGRVRGLMTDQRPILSASTASGSFRAWAPWSSGPERRSPGTRLFSNGGTYRFGAWRGSSSRASTGNALSGARLLPVRPGTLAAPLNTWDVFNVILA